MILSQYATTIRDRLAEAPIACADPMLHAKQILEHALKLDTAALYVQWGDPVTEEACHEIEKLLERRLSGEPFQYIVGYEDFWKHRFQVGPGVLIPRKETECLVEVTLRCFEASKTKPIEIGELGPGTGNIGLSVLAERPQWKWTAVEKNEASMPYLKRNTQTILEGQPRYQAIKGDFFEQAIVPGSLDAVVSNPPYVSSLEYTQVSVEVTREPKLALDGGEDGLSVLRPLAKKASESLKVGGYLIVEIGSTQNEAATELFESCGFGAVQCVNDTAGLPRVVIGTWNG